MLAEIEADTCSGCGQPLSETLRKEAFEGYEAPDPLACQGCKALIVRQRKHAEENEFPALRFLVNRTWQDPTGKP